MLICAKWNEASNSKKLSFSFFLLKYDPHVAQNGQYLQGWTKLTNLRRYTRFHNQETTISNHEELCRSRTKFVVASLQDQTETLVNSEIPKNVSFPHTDDLQYGTF